MLEQYEIVQSQQAELKSRKDMELKYKRIFDIIRPQFGKIDEIISIVNKEFA